MTEISDIGSYSGACYEGYKGSKEINVMKSECDLIITGELRGEDLSAFEHELTFPKGEPKHTIKLQKISCINICPTKSQVS